MKDVLENELFSAYLDGELTAAEQADVGQLLAHSPAARQLLEELRALSSKLQALPQQKLGEDLSRQVLGVAQRRMLATSAAPGELPQPAPSTRRAILRRLVGSRAVVWSALAVAVAVILTVMDRGPKKQIAVTPPAAEEKAGRTPEIGPAPNQDEGKRHIREKVQTVRGGPIAKGAAGSQPVQWDLLVQCRISPEGDGKEVFDKALADNRIVWDETPAGTGVLTGNTAAVQEQREEQVGQQKSEDANRPAADHSYGAVPAVPAEKVDMVYVEATWVQINGLLTALAAQPQAVSLVLSGPTAEVETLGRSSRNLAGQVQLRVGGGTGAVAGFQVGGASAEPPAARPEQRPGGGYEGQDQFNPRAYARRLRSPAPGVNRSMKSPGPTVPPGRAPKPEQHWAGQTRQQEAHRTDAGVPMVRALFVLHVADLKSRAAAVEARPFTGKAASEDRKAAPPPVER